MLSSQSFLKYDSVVCVNRVVCVCVCVCVCVAKPATQPVKYKDDFTNHIGGFMALGIRMSIFFLSNKS